MLTYDEQGNQIYVFTPRQLHDILSKTAGPVGTVDLPKKIRCDYCGTVYYSIFKDNRCPRCGAPLQEKHIELIYMYDGVPAKVVTESEYEDMFGKNGERSAGWKKD